MKYATYLFVIVTILLFGVATYFHFIVYDEIMYERFMGFGTLSLTFLLLPCFLLTRFFKKQKEKDNKIEK